MLKIFPLNKKTIIFLGFLVFLFFVPFCFSNTFSVNSAIASQCDDEIDNDNDFFIDFVAPANCAAPDCLGPDLDCTDASDNREGIDITGSVGGILGKIVEFLSEQLKGILAGFTYVFDVLGSIIILLPAAILGLGVLVSGLAAGLAIGITNWVIGVFLAIHIIDSNIVEVGWTFSRDFVNMFFILILAFIGLATILRLEAYEVKKTFPLLLLMTLLMNFSLVFVGIIVDFSEIITAFFLNSIGGGINWLAAPISQTVNYYTGLGQAIYSSLTGGFGFSQMLFWACKGVVLIVFNITAALIFLVASFIFFLRVIILWLLAIVAPFAFISYVFPSTRKVWSQWWDHLIQWSIIGIPILFALYLGTYINNNSGVFNDEWKVFSIGQGDSLTEYLMDMPTLFRGGVADLVSSLIQPLASLIILIIGILAAISFAPSGARQIMSGVKKAGLWAANQRPVALKLGGAAGWGAETMGKSAEKIKDWEKKMASRGKVPGWIGKAALRPFYHATRAADLMLGPKLMEFEQETKRVGLPKDFPNWDRAKQQDFINRYLVTSQDKTTAAGQMADKKYFQTADPKFKDDIFEKVQDVLRTNDVTYKKYIAEILASDHDRITKAIKLGFDSMGLNNTDASRRLDPDGVTRTDKERKEYETSYKIDVLTQDILNAAPDGTALRRELEREAAAKGLPPERVADYVNDYLAASMTHAGELKTEPWKNMSKDSLKSLSARLTLRTKGSGKHVQTIRDTFDAETIRNVFEGPGGILNYQYKEEIDEAKALNPQLYGQIQNNPGLGDIREKLEEKENTLPHRP